MPIGINSVLTHVAHHRHESRWWLLWLCLAVVWFSNIQYRLLVDPDEGRYAEIPREMLISGDWVAPHQNGMQYLEKPPLQYWATAVSYAIFGVERWTSRMWSTGLGLLGIVMVYYASRRLYGITAARLTALILFSCPLYIVIGHINVLDMGLSFFTTGALLSFLFAQRATDITNQKRWMAVVWIAVALAFLQKGLIAFVLPALALLSYSAIQRDFRLWRQLHLRSGIVLVVLICVPWVVAMTLRNPAFLNFFFIHEHFARFGTHVHGRNQPWWFFIAIFVLGTLPWSYLLPRSIVSAWQSEPEGRVFSGERLLVIWIIVVVTFFSLSGSKLAPYITPAIPIAAMLVGRDLARHDIAERLTSPLLLSLSFALLLLLFRAAVPYVLHGNLKLEMYLAMGRWSFIGGIVVLLGAVCSTLQSGTTGKVLSIAPSFYCGVMLLLNASDAIALRQSAVLAAPSIHSTLSEKTQLYCVGTYPESLPFLVGRTCVQVAYRGEAEVDLDATNKNWIPTLDQFVSGWNESPNGIALIEIHVWHQLQPSLRNDKVIYQDKNIVVIAR